MITVFVGDVHEYLAVIAQSQDPTAKLVTEKNYKKLAAGTWYCSLGDFQNSKTFVQALQQADEIIYTPPNEWSSTSIQLETEKQLLDLKILNFCKVRNIDNLSWPKLKTFLDLSAVRKIEGPQIWVAGCSISHGMGVPSNQRYGQLVADRLNLPVSFLTCPGSSIAWAGDQLLRSDIRTGDTVIWGLTSLERLCYYSNNYVAHVNQSYYTTHPEFDTTVPLSELSSQNQLYQSIVKIHEVINFCDKIHVNYVLAGILTDLSHYTIINDHYISLTEGCPDYPKDMLGTDTHPGPLTHKWYADQILKKLN